MDLDLTPEEQRLLAKDDLETERMGYWMACIIGPLLIAVGIVAVHAVTWLQSGKWPTLTLDDLAHGTGFRGERLSWVGTQKIVDWIMDCPVAGVLPIISMITVILLTRNDHKPVPEALKTAQMKRARKSRKPE